MRFNPGPLKVETDIRILQQMCGDLADEKGFWDKGKEHNTPATQILNMIGELSEAWEEIRGGREMTDRYYLAVEGRSTPYFFDQITGHINKPEGVPSELADTVIRIMDTCQHYGLDLAELISEKLRYNATRPTRHGGKIY